MGIIKKRILTAKLVESMSKYPDVGDKIGIVDISHYTQINQLRAPEFPSEEYSQRNQQ